VMCGCEAWTVHKKERNVKYVRMENSRGGCNE
jgi:hypothetical protein